MMENTFELMQAFIQIVQQSYYFHGLPDVVIAHLNTFLEVCDNDAIRLRVFSFLIEGKS